MSTLYLIRHGQASFGKANYDQLSELGKKQMYLLAQYWLKWGITPSAIYSGTLERQKASAECVSELFKKAGKNLPSPVIIKELNEYDTSHLLTGSFSTLIAQNPEISALVKQLSSSGPVDLANNKKNFQKIFSKAMELWVDEKLKLPGMESFKEFSSRVQKAIETIISEQGSSRTVAVFTSGGPISAVMQKALKLSDKIALELGWMIANSSITEFRYSPDRFSLVSFNATPHLSEPGLISYR